MFWKSGVLSLLGISLLLSAMWNCLIGIQSCVIWPPSYCRCSSMGTQHLGAHANSHWGCCAQGYMSGHSLYFSLLKHTFTYLYVSRGGGKIDRIDLQAKSDKTDRFLPNCWMTGSSLSVPLFVLPTLATYRTSYRLVLPLMSHPQYLIWSMFNMKHVQLCLNWELCLTCSQTIFKYLWGSFVSAAESFISCLSGLQF